MEAAEKRVLTEAKIDWHPREKKTLSKVSKLATALAADAKKKLVGDLSFMHNSATKDPAAKKKLGDMLKIAQQAVAILKQVGDETRSA